MKSFTHNSYTEAMSDLKGGKKATFARWDAGEGYVSEGEWNASAKRVVIRLYNPDGTRCA